MSVRKEKEVKETPEVEEDDEERRDSPKEFHLIRGSDPRVATCRGKLQNKRSKLNQEINKELRLRAGAENLFKATTNRKLKETVALELSFVNSNLQLLKEQLAELNSSVELYQNDSTQPVMPMIPLGLKETKEIDFREPFKDFILEHYSEDGSHYEDAIADFMDLRQAMRTPLRDTAGVALLFQYYNQLYFVERRFFPPDRSLGIYFEWYDSLTGVPSCQRTVAFEKACVLFNMGALYTQLGAKQDRLLPKGLDSAVDSFLRASGTFRYILDNFTNAPSMDLGPEMLDMLVQLMLAQARECLFEKLDLQSRDRRDIDVCLDLAQEAAQVAEVYSKVHALISVAAVRDYVPYSWAALVQVKREHYAALSHFHVAAGVLGARLADLSPRTRDTLQFLHEEGDARTQLEVRLPQDDAERKLLGRAHLREALLLHEESQRLHRMCRELRGKAALSAVLKKCHSRAMDAYTYAEEEDDFREVLDPPRVLSSTKFQLSLTPPDFSHYRVEDLFRGLGPVAIFSAKHHWTAPRSVQLQRLGGEGFGFSVRGDAPVIVAGVDQGSLADFGGMKEGDFIVAISDRDVKWSAHEEVVKLIKLAGDTLSLKLVTPMDKSYLKQPKGGPKGSVSTSSSSSGVSSGQPSPAGSLTGNSHKKLTWNPFRKSAHHKEHGPDHSVILR
ncbi:rhophilin-2 isoform X1 [Bacillus rossius redtenbacheri]|uniref:rhophilin-2 isoform X1 n=1 Tax=Bacillus rossius redtenbacheri TaxID=93214 RepID=UPI002FDDB826